MTTSEIADRLAALCRKGDFETAQNELFAENAVSIEPEASPAFAKEIKGLQAIKEKGKKWNEMVKETHEISVSDPLIAANSFTFTMRMNVTMKEGGQMDITELCVYLVKDGKIVAEQFFM